MSYLKLIEGWHDTNKTRYTYRITLNRVVSNRIMYNLFHIVSCFHVVSCRVFVLYHIVSKFYTIACHTVLIFKKIRHNTTSGGFRVKQGGQLTPLNFEK
jgi:hypothetical protein